MRTFPFYSVAVTAVLGCLVECRSSYAAVKLIGAFEGTMASPYTTPDAIPPTVDGGCGQGAGTVNWCTDIGISVAPQFIDKNDPLDAPYWGAVTQGQQALLLTFPGEWASVQAPYLRLHGQEQLHTDTLASGFQFMAFDVTTFGGYDEPPDPTPANQGPYRQVHTIFNGTDIGFYGKTESGDDDVQIDFEMADWDETSFTTTIVQDLTGPLPPANAFDANNDPDDGKIAINALAGFVTPTAADFTWQIVLVLQGRDYPPPSTTVYQVTVGIDNFRLCDTAAECTAPPLPTPLPGDFNADLKVDGLDYTVWRNNFNDPTEADIHNNGDGGDVSETDFALWKLHYGDVGAPGGGGFAIPEPATIWLGLCLVGSVTGLRRSR